MFNLPKSTQIKKNIYKNLLYKKFPKELSGSKRERFDQEISKITIINEISEQSIHVLKTDRVPAIYVVKIDLKTRDYSDANIILISKLFGQNLLLILQYNEEHRLAIYETQLIVSEWKQENDINLTLNGLNLQSIWENLVMQVGQIEIEEGNTLQKQIDIESKREKLIKLIHKTEKRAKKEMQAKKRFELFKEIKKMRKELEDL